MTSPTPLDVGELVRIKARRDRVMRLTFKLAADGGTHTAFRMSIPPHPDDSDMLLVALCADVDRLVAQVERGAEDTARLDWIDARVGRNAGLIVQGWDSDGRRFVPRDSGGWPCLLVHKFASRGGADESVRDAIDAVTHSAPSSVQGAATSDD